MVVMLVVVSSNWHYAIQGWDERGGLPLPSSLTVRDELAEGCCTVATVRFDPAALLLIALQESYC